LKRLQINYFKYQIINYQINDDEKEFPLFLRFFIFGQTPDEVGDFDDRRDQHDGRISLTFSDFAEQNVLQALLSACEPENY
jgi:hypothetical protein